jgi:hypothetical protein
MSFREGYKKSQASHFFDQENASSETGSVLSVFGGELE